MTRTEEIVEVLKRWITDRSLQPGDALPTEKAMIAHFRASRSSVREALRALEYQGLIRTRRGAGGGTEIARVSYDRTADFLRGYLYFDEITWEQIYEARALLEPAIAREVVGRLEEDDFAALEATIRTGETGADGDMERLRQAEIEFHAILARRASNPILGFMARFLNSVMSDLTVSYNLIDPGGESFRRPSRHRRRAACRGRAGGGTADGGAHRRGRLLRLRTGARAQDRYAALRSGGDGVQTVVPIWLTWAATMLQPSGIRMSVLLSRPVRSCPSRA
jgi:DNA-binding FadR family transcriptional regulator